MQNLIIGSFTLHRRGLQAELGGADVQPSNKKLPGLVFFCFGFVVFEILSFTLTFQLRWQSSTQTVMSAAAQFTE